MVLMGKVIEDTVTKAVRAVETVLNNELPMPRCSKEKIVVKALREKVRGELANRLGPVGPSSLK